jgi:hypothetical protein
MSSSELKEDADGDEGAPAQDGTPVNASITARDIEELDDTRLVAQPIAFALW